MNRKLTPYSENTARRVAIVIGPQSAAAAALVDLYQRRGTGEDVSLYLDDKSSILVGPTIPPSDSGDKR